MEGGAEFSMGDVNADEMSLYTKMRADGNPSDPFDLRNSFGI
jgi:hypothetical protein